MSQYYLSDSEGESDFVVHTASKQISNISSKEVSNTSSKKVSSTSSKGISNKSSRRTSQQSLTSEKDASLKSSSAHSLVSSLSRDSDEDSKALFSKQTTKVANANASTLSASTSANAARFQTPKRLSSDSASDTESEDGSNDGSNDISKIGSNDGLKSTSQPQPSEITAANKRFGANSLTKSDTAARASDGSSNSGSDSESYSESDVESDVEIEIVSKGVEPKGATKSISNEPPRRGNTAWSENSGGDGRSEFPTSQSVSSNEATANHERLVRREGDEDTSKKTDETNTLFVSTNKSTEESDRGTEGRPRLRSRLDTALAKGRDGPHRTGDSDGDEESNMSSRPQSARSVIGAEGAVKVADQRLGLIGFLTKADEQSPSELVAQELQSDMKLKLRSFTWTPSEKSNRGRYYGTMDGHVRSGWGIYVWEDGREYRGQWKEDAMNGRGLYIWRSEVYVSEGHGMASGIKDFPGAVDFTYATSIYKGDFHEDKMQGNGVYKFADGSVYEGEWHNDEMSGQGVLWGSDGSVYKGAFLHDQSHGLGTKTYADKSIYDGEWQAGVPHGRGNVIWEAGKVQYKGEFVSGAFEGRGCATWRQCVRGRIFVNTYDGGWTMGVRHGHGKYLWADGTVFEGAWRKGVLQPRKGVFRLPEGTVKSQP